MNKARVLRPLMVMITFIACSVIMATPTAATATTDDITAGVITFTKAGITPEVLDLSPGGTGICGTGIYTWDLTSTTIGSTGLAVSAVRTFGTTGTFLLVLTRSTTGNTSGALNSTGIPHSFGTPRIAIVMTVYNTTVCTPSGTPICTLAVILGVSGTSTSTSPSDTKTFNGASVGTVVGFPTCSVGPSYLIGAASSITTSFALHQVI